MARAVRKKPARPRAPLPRQTGGPHRDQSKVIPRKAKHRGRVRRDGQD